MVIEKLDAHMIFSLEWFDLFDQNDLVVVYYILVNVLYYERMHSSV